MDLPNGQDWNRPRWGCLFIRFKCKVSSNAGVMARDGLGIVGSGQHATVTTRRGVSLSVRLVVLPTLGTHAARRA